MEKREDLLQKISAVCFVVQDLKLFLDTHPENAEAMRLYGDYVREAKKLKERYTAFYGPLMAETFEPDGEWKWIDDPWPWDKC